MEDIEDRPSSQINEFIPLVLTILCALLLLFLGACGGKVSEGFSNVNKELSTESSVGWNSEGGVALPTAKAGEDVPAALVLEDTAPESGSFGAADTDSSAEEGISDEALGRSIPSDDGLAAPPGYSAPGAPRPEASRPSRQGQPAPLKAGERDDNADIEDYLTYLDTYQGPPAPTVDIRERYRIIVVNNDQRPLMDARVRIYDGQQQLFSARTYANGHTLFLPNAVGVSPNTQTLRIVADHDQSHTELTVERGSQEEITIALPDATPPETLQLQVLFLLDTTGSMGDELARIQDTIDTIAQRIDGFAPRPTTSFGLVAYRDRGDDYVTRVYDFTPDVPAFRTILNSLSAGGGGDTPESLNEALHEAVRGVSWDENTVRLIFLVADAPPHLDYEDDYDYLEETQHAVAQGVKVYAIAASNTDLQAEYIFRQIAQQTMGTFIFLTYQPGATSGVPGERRDDLTVGEESFTVERLDDLIVKIVEKELAAAMGIQ